tara:strand:- start:77 stop:199 length:123 start_codon:yes stop_codon:yes gene_type:complete
MQYAKDWFKQYKDGAPSNKFDEVSGSKEVRKIKNKQSEKV